MLTVNNQNQTKIGALLLGLVNLVPYKKETLLLSFRRGTRIHWSTGEVFWKKIFFKFVQNFKNICEFL